MPRNKVMQDQSNRSVRWQKWLRCCGKNYSSEQDNNIELRDAYERKRHDLYLRHLSPQDNQEDAILKDLNLTVNNPLSAHPDSVWSKYWQIQNLVKEVNQDIERLCLEPLEKIDNASEMLCEVLVVWAMEHQSFGYKQGMHDILAHILLTLYEDSLQCRHPHQHPPPHPHHPQSHAPPPPPTQQERSVFPSMMFLTHDSYILFAALMGTSGPAKKLATMYDSRDVGVMVVMDAVMSRLHRVDPDLAQHLQGLGVEPHPFLVRWLRLMFSREFHRQDVLAVWDAILHVHFILEAREEPWLDMYESIAVAMVQFVGPDILTCSEMHTALRRLVRYPPVEDISVIIQKAYKALELTDSERQLFEENHIFSHVSNLPTTDNQSSFSSPASIPTSSSFPPPSSLHTPSPRLSPLESNAHNFTQSPSVQPIVRSPTLPGSNAGDTPPTNPRGSPTTDDVPDNSSTSSLPNPDSATGADQSASLGGMFENFDSTIDDVATSMGAFLNNAAGATAAALFGPSPQTHHSDISPGTPPLEQPYEKEMQGWGKDVVCPEESSSGLHPQRYMLSPRLERPRQGVHDPTEPPFPFTSHATSDVGSSPEKPAQAPKTVGSSSSKINASIFDDNTFDLGGGLNLSLGSGETSEANSSASFLDDLDKFVDHVSSTIGGRIAKAVSDQSSERVEINPEHHISRSDVPLLDRKGVFTTISSERAEQANGGFLHEGPVPSPGDLTGSHPGTESVLSEIGTRGSFRPPPRYDAGAVEGFWSYIDAYVEHGDGTTDITSASQAVGSLAHDPTDTPETVCQSAIAAVNENMRECNIDVELSENEAVGNSQGVDQKDAFGSSHSREELLLERAEPLDRSFDPTVTVHVGLQTPSEAEKIYSEEKEKVSLAVSRTQVKAVLGPSIQTLKGMLDSWEEDMVNIYEQDPLSQKRGYFGSVANSPARCNKTDDIQTLKSVLLDLNKLYSRVENMSID